MKKQLIGAGVGLGLVGALTLLPDADAANVPHAKVVSDVVVAIEAKPSGLSTALDESGNPIWRPYVKEVRPAFDPATHKPPQPQRVIASAQVTDTWTTPVAKTQTELDTEAIADKDATVD